MNAAMSNCHGKSALLSIRLLIPVRYAICADSHLLTEARRRPRILATSKTSYCAKQHTISKIRARQCKTAMFCSKNRWEAGGSDKNRSAGSFFVVKIAHFEIFNCGFSCRTASNNEEWTSRCPL
jgi:hypothetical protein